MTSPVFAVSSEYAGSLLVGCSAMSCYCVRRERGGHARYHTPLRVRPRRLRQNDMAKVVRLFQDLGQAYVLDATCSFSTPPLRCYPVHSFSQPAYVSTSLSPRKANAWNPIISVHHSPVFQPHPISAPCVHAMPPITHTLMHCAHTYRMQHLFDSSSKCSPILVHSHTHASLARVVQQHLSCSSPSTPPTWCAVGGGKGAGLEG